MRVYNNFRKSSAYIKLHGKNIVLLYYHLKIRLPPKKGRKKTWRYAGFAIKEKKEDVLNEMVKIAQIRQEKEKEFNCIYFYNTAMNFFTRFDCRPSHILYRFRFKLYDGYRESKVYTIIFPAIDKIDASYLIDKYVQSPNMEHISLMSLNVATYNIAFFNYFEFPIIEDFKEEFINSISIDEELQLEA